MTSRVALFDPAKFLADIRTPAKAAKPAKVGGPQPEDSQLSQLSQAQLAEIDERVTELADERHWLAERGLLLPGDGDDVEFLAHLAKLREERGLLAVLVEVRRHWAAAVDCKVLPLADPEASPRVPRPVGTGGAE